MLDRSATSPSTGAPRSPSVHGSSSTMPTTVNGAFGASLAVCATSAAQVLVPTTRTRRFAANPCRQTTSQTVVRQKTDIAITRSEEHTSELQSRQYLVCRLLLEKKKKKT